MLMLLAGCQTVPTQPGTGTVETAAGRAAALARQGRHDDAADDYLKLAETSRGDLQQRYLILAARERRLAGRIGAAQAIVDALEEPIAEGNLVGWAIVAGDLALARGDAEGALSALSRAPETDNPVAAAELLRIRGQALLRLGDPVAGTSVLLEREIWLEDANAIADNQQLLWQELRRYGIALGPEQLAQVTDPVLLGWLQLGEIAASLPPGGRGLASALTRWQLENPNHPANQSLVPELLAQTGSVAEMPQRVALLLPLSGRQQLSGAAIRDGFMAAHFSSGDVLSAPLLRVYDVDAFGAADAYRRAVADGAQFVVGPLLKPAVEEIAAAGISVPTLALNYLPSEILAPPGLFQFALLPEDEASAAAERAIRLGQLRALVLVPNGAWGRRLLTSFAETYQGLGGKIIDYRYYDAGTADYSAGIQDVLLIRESKDRQTRLSANLGVELGFEPRRRDDIDLIFMAATDGSAKLIRPQLKFYYAGGIPTYATSAIYNSGSSSNLDLNGIMFADMPWVVDPDPLTQSVQQTLDSYWPDQARRRARLLAMGFDAYQLVPELASGGRLSGGELPGVTGRLYLSGDRRIHRRLSWAIMIGGQPSPLVPLDDFAPLAE
jgi:outer membrane PBP1 activator LpoA protein